MKRKFLLAAVLLITVGSFVQRANAYFNVYSTDGTFLGTEDPNNNPQYEGDIIKHPPDKIYPPVRPR